MAATHPRRWRRIGVWRAFLLGIYGESLRFLGTHIVAGKMRHVGDGCWWVAEQLSLRTQKVFWIAGDAADFVEEELAHMLEAMDQGFGAGLVAGVRGVTGAE